MKNTNLIMSIVTLTLALTACKKGGDTITNIYGPENPKAPNRTMLKAYGLTDSSTVIRFTYQNNEIGKIKELISFDSGAPVSKYVILYNGSNKPEAYQSYTLPANTLNEQGTIKRDENDRVIEVIKRKVNGDTIGILSIQYTDVDYQPASFSFYNHTKKRTTRYEYFIYDNRGNLTKMISYEDNGTDALFKSEEVDASGYGKAINPLNQLYYYIITIGSDYGFSTSAPLYFSNFLPASSRSQSYTADGKPSYVNISNLNITTDNNNNVVKLNTGGLNPQNIFFKY